MALVFGLILVLGVFLAVLYFVAGRLVAVRGRRSDARVDRVLHRAVTRCGFAQFLATGAVVAIVAIEKPEIPAAVRLALIYASPLVWAWVWVLGSSWLELRVRGVGVPLLRFHRFNVFSSFLLLGQRLPLLCAAIAAPANLSGDDLLLPGVAIHLTAAILIGFLIRWALVSFVGGVEPFPDRRLAVRVREIARMAGVTLRGIFQVRTERGQSVNAFATTTSHLIFVAKGMREGLGRDEMKAVLLHEVGHLAQNLMNAFRNVSVIFAPLLVWSIRAVLSLPKDERSWWWFLVLACAFLVGSKLANRIYRNSERRADLFAAEWSPPGSLASALRKLYAQNLVPEHSRRKRHPDLAERLELLEGPDAPVTQT